ncbi:DUF5710 domain-containing protein [Streptomyces sp. SID3212]|uniref:DUF5710 domain-containing protein n=1 Tax=Streptomyces sp. SID3212 TaxID=2690259 RepID=UPI001F4176E2|nr:DUF5710 domain-containing protein [Streptomyces sp. SID3212]
MGRERRAATPLRSPGRRPPLRHPRRRPFRRHPPPRLHLSGRAGGIWLDVPFAEKDEAKKGGARWDSAAKRWYAPHGGMVALQRWAPAPDVPDRTATSHDHRAGRASLRDLRGRRGP